MKRERARTRERETERDRERERKTKQGTAKIYSLTDIRNFQKTFLLRFASTRLAQCWLKTFNYLRYFFALRSWDWYRATSTTEPFARGSYFLLGSESCTFKAFLKTLNPGSCGPRLNQNGVISTLYSLSLCCDPCRRVEIFHHCIFSGHPRTWLLLFFQHATHAIPLTSSLP